MPSRPYVFGILSVHLHCESRTDAGIIPGSSKYKSTNFPFTHHIILPFAPSRRVRSSVVGSFFRCFVMLKAAV